MREAVKELENGFHAGVAAGTGACISGGSEVPASDEWSPENAMDVSQEASDTMKRLKNKNCSLKKVLKLRSKTCVFQLMTSTYIVDT